MGTPYDVFTSAFLEKVTEYNFIQLNAYDRNLIIDTYMKKACAQFNSLCDYDLLTRDDIIRELDASIPDEDIDEITDIVSEGMLVQWMKPYVFRADNLENVLNTSDYSSYSPAEILNRVKEVYEMIKSDFTSRMKSYSYDHGDLSDLSL